MTYMLCNDWVPKQTQLYEMVHSHCLSATMLFSYLSHFCIDTTCLALIGHVNNVHTMKCLSFLLVK